MEKTRRNVKMHFLRQSRGNTSIEYVIVCICLISVVVGSMQVMQGAFGQLYTRVADDAAGNAAAPTDDVPTTDIFGPAAQEE